MNRWVGVQKGGTETHIKELASRLAARGHFVGILTSSGHELDETSTKIKKWYVRRNPGEHSFSGRSGVRTYFYASIFVVAALLYLLRLAARGYRFDVVSVHFALEAFLMRLVRPVLGLPFVFVFEGYSDIEARQAFHADVQIAISDHIAQECWSRFSYKPRVIPMGVDFERFRLLDSRTSKEFARRSVGLPAKSRVVLSVGRVAPHKGLDTLAKATPGVSTKYPETTVVVVGDGSYRKHLESLIHSLGLNNFVLIGKVSDQDLPLYYWAADLFVLGETNEGFSGGLVLLEAMSAGLPLVATKVGGIPETVEGAAILIPPRDDHALEEAICKLIEDENLRKELSTKGLQIAQRRDWANVMKRYESSYSEAFESLEA